MVFLAVVLPTQTEVHLAIKILAEELLFKKNPKKQPKQHKTILPPKKSQTNKETNKKNPLVFKDAPERRS